MCFTCSPCGSLLETHLGYFRKDEVQEMKINQNISAVIVNDQLLRNENSVAASVQRLSSGLKFNNAKDNPSGMAISFKMQAQINALNRASLNATDGTSMVETIDGAMGEMTEVLQRIRELCVQAANDTNMPEDREAIQQEIDALKEEVNRISTATEFNGKTLLDGSLDRRTYVTSEAAQAGGGQKEVSMYDKITNVIISDEVQAGNYNVEIIEPAGHAALVAAGDDAKVQNNAISEEQAGIVCINGVKAEIKAGMSPEEVYTVIRDAADSGWVNVFVTDGNQTLPITDKTLDTQGYGKDNTGYKFGSSLAFVSQNYGSDEDITITCDNKELAEILGLDNPTGPAGKTVENTVEEVKEYSISIKGQDVPQSVNIVGVPNAANAGKKVEATAAGTVYVNGVAAKITAGMSPQEAFEALQRACAAADVMLSGDQVAVPADYGFEKKLTFTSEAKGLNAKINITYDNEELGDLFGPKDIAADPGMQLERDEKVVSIEYKSVAEGEDAQVSIQENGEIRKEYTGQAVIKADGNQVVITDKSGFEMSFEIRGDVASGGQPQNPGDPDTNTQLITIEATDIGTLQLQIGANEGQELAVRVPVLNTRSLYMDDLDVRKVDGSDRGMDTMDKAIGIVTAARSLMGAYENRLDYIKGGLDATEEDMTTAISRLGDVDMAQEMTEYTNANVLTQASISVLSQANDLPQQVLSLLQG